MSKNKKAILIILGIGMFFAMPVLANGSLTVDLESDPLFNEANFLPGNSVVRWFTVTNNSAQTQAIAVEAINFPGFPDPDDIPSDDLSRVLTVVIREEGGSDLYGGSTGEKTLFNFYKDGENKIFDLLANNSQKFEFVVYFPKGKGNDWQEKTTSFDVLIGLQGGGGDNGGGGGDNGDNGGGGVPRGLTIREPVEITLGTTSATITWLTNYSSTSQVIYDTIPGQFDLGTGSPNYGYANLKEGDDSGIDRVTAHSVTITGLIPGVTYYYRSISYGSFAASTEYNFTTLESGEIFIEQKPIEISGNEISNNTEQMREEGSQNKDTGNGEENDVDEEVIEPPVFNEVVIDSEDSSFYSGGFLATIGGLFNLGNFFWLLIALVILIILFLLFKKRKKEEEN